jgi:hypothetical protein
VNRIGRGLNRLGGTPQSEAHAIEVIH